LNTNRDVILVDLSNIRDQTGEKARTDRGLVPAFSRSYLDGFEDALRTLAPFAHIVLIAGRAILSKDLWIEGGKRQSTDFKWMKHRTKSRGESDFVYLMQEQMDGEEHIKADELILHLARQLNGFIISNDNYNDFEYRELLREVGHKHFGPKYDHPSDSWSFELKPHDQVDLLKRPDGFLLDDCLTPFSSLSQEEEEEFRQYLYDIAIPDFWSERDQYTLDSKKGITQKFSEILEYAKIINVRQVQNSVSTASILRGLSAFGIPHIRSRRFMNQFVELFGRIKVHDDQTFLEGTPGDKAVLLEGFDEVLNPHTGFLQLTGKLRFENDQAILKRRSSSVVVEIDIKQALKLVSTPRETDRNKENFIRWAMKPLPWQYRQLRPMSERLAELLPIPDDLDEPRIQDGIKVIGEPFGGVRKVVDGDASVGRGQRSPKREPVVQKLVSESGKSNTKSILIAVAMAIITVLAALWLRGDFDANRCQESNSCIDDSNSPVPVLDPAPTKWVWHSREKVWVHG